ncbi:MAG: putative zinc-binding protein [Anaerolineales bacterium]|jgi:uncharacterized metal-binding protein
MVDLPKKKVGIVACSGEELAEGTVTRLAALEVLEKLRPADTVTICLPLFLAGGEGDRAFAKFYPTIAVDGCELKCAAKATEEFSGKPAASIVVSEIVKEANMKQPSGLRKLDQAGLEAVNAIAKRMASLVDELLEKRWSRSEAEFIEMEEFPEPQAEIEASCACGSGIPIQNVRIEGREVTLIGLPLIFRQFREENKQPSDMLKHELLEIVKIYNPVPAGADEPYAETILREYVQFINGKDFER